MKNYFVEPKDATDDFPKAKISAASHNDAYREYLSSYGYPNCALIVTNNGLLGYSQEFGNPVAHLEKERKQQEKEKKRAKKGADKKAKTSSESYSTRL